MSRWAFGRKEQTEYSDAVIGSLLTREAYRVEGFGIADECASDSLRAGSCSWCRIPAGRARSCAMMWAKTHGHMESIQPALLAFRRLPALTAGAGRNAAPRI